MDEAQGISFSLYVDPTTKKTFVREVARTAEEAANAAGAAGKKVKPLGEIFSGRSLLQLAAAAYALRRLGMAADEPSEKLRKVGKEAHELAATVGNELQAAAGEMAAGMMPGIKAVLELGAGFRGAMIGGVAFLVMMPRISRALAAMGLAAGPWGAAIAAGFMLAGAAVQAMGAKAHAVEEGMRSYREAMQARTTEIVQAEGRMLEERIAKLSKEREEVKQTQDQWGMVAGVHKLIAGDMASEAASLDAQIGSANRMLAVVREELALRQELSKLGPPVITDAMLSGAEKLDQINTKLATGTITLAEAREESKKFSEEELAKRIELLKSEEHLGKLYENELLTAGLIVSMSIDQASMDRARVKQAEELKRLQAEENSHLQFRAGKTKEIGQENEKARAEVFNRGRLEAQILDTVRQQGPAAELLYLIGVRRKLIAEGHRDTETHILEIDKDIAALQQQMAQRAEQAAQKRRAAAAEGLSDEKRLTQEVLDRETFRRMILTSLAELEGATEETLRARRIAGLQAELGLRRLSSNELIAKQKELNELPVGLDPKIDQQREGLKELIGLLIEQKRVAAEFWQPMIQGLDQATHQGALALTQMFTRGKVDAKRFSEDLLNIFEQMIAEMLGKEIFKTLLSLILSIFNPLGAIGAAAGGGGGAADILLQAGMKGGRLPSTPNIPWPQPAGAMMTVRLGGIERRLEAMTERIETALRAPVTGGFVTIKGSTLRVALARETQAAATRKL